MTLILNGERHSLEMDTLTLPELLEQLGFGERPVLVEHNGTALHQREHTACQLNGGDRLEIIQIVAGG